MRHGIILQVLLPEIKSQQVDDKKQVLRMFSKLVNDPEKFKEILKKSK